MMRNTRFSPESVSNIYVWSLFKAITLDERGGLILLTHCLSAQRARRTKSRRPGGPLQGVMNVWGDECLKIGRGWWMSEVMNVGVMNVGQSQRTPPTPNPLTAEFRLHTAFLTWDFPKMLSKRLHVNYKDDIHDHRELWKLKWCFEDAAVIFAGLVVLTPDQVHKPPDKVQIFHIFLWSFI